MSRAKRTDQNQIEIVKVMRDMGASVWVTSHVGNGAPDFVAGIRGVNLLVEVKLGEKSPSRRKLTPFEEKFHLSWKGQICIIESVDDAIALINRTGVKK